MAAGLLRVPATTLRSWTKGQDYKVQGKRRRFHPPIPLEAGQEVLTFYNLVEAFVLSSMRRDGRSAGRFSWAPASRSTC